MKNVKTRMQWIKEELSKDFSAPAIQVIQSLQSNRDFNYPINEQHIYLAKHAMRKKKKKAVAIRLANKKPLSEVILEVLKTNPNGLKDFEILDKVKKNGYLTSSKNFFLIFRHKLYDLATAGILVKNNMEYKIKMNNSILPRITNDNQEIRQILVDFAKKKGVKNPEQYPEKLLATKKLLAKAEQEYKNLLSDLTV